MKTQIFKCSKCNEYTLNEICKSCKEKTLTIKPAKYSIEDKFGEYRRIAKKNGKI